jgi:hypothetical protein
MTTLQTINASASPEVQANENFDTLSAAGIFGKRQPVTTGLTWGYYGGRYNGNTVADGTVTLTNAATNYVVVHRTTGVVSVSTSNTNYNNTATYARLYQLTVAGGVVTATVDGRMDTGGVLQGASVTGGTVTSVDASGGVQTASGSLITATGTVRGASVFNAQTGTTYTIVTGDRGKLLTLSNASAIAVTLPQAGASFPDGWYVDVKCIGAGTATITPTTSTVDGAASAALSINQSARIVSDGTNYRTVLTGGSGSGAVATDVIWDAKGDLAVGTGANTAAKLTVGTNGQVLTADSAEATGAKWATISGSTQGRHAIYIGAGAMAPSISGGCAALAGLTSGANQPDVWSLDFDPTTQEFAQFWMTMPKSWNEGTVTFAPVWSHASTATNFSVVWQLQGYAASNDDAIATSYGTAQTSTDTGGTTNDLYVGPESAAITIAGTPAAEDTVFFRVARNPTDGSDTMAIDARLMGVVLYITTAADTDA